MNYTDNMLKEIQNLFAEGSSYESIIGQNKDDHKIDITDIAISKVPLSSKHSTSFSVNVIFRYMMFHFS